MFKVLIVFLGILALVVCNEITTCNLAPTATSHQSPLCNLKHLSNSIKSQLIESRLFNIDATTGDLTWLNKYHPVEARWSKICPSSGLCSNTNCDFDGFCQIGQSLRLVDNVNSDIQNKFKSQDSMTLFNVTFNLEDENTRETVLVQSTRSLDILRSRPNRITTSFQLKSMDESNHLVKSLGCQVAGEDMFPIRYDPLNERLYMKLNSINQQGCYVFKLYQQRPESIEFKKEFTVVVNLKDNRLDRPRFDYLVYNFTVTENMPLDSVIGTVHAKFFTQKSNEDSNSDDAIEYRIVPFMSAKTSFNPNIMADAPVKIDYLSGLLSQASNIDRERYLNDQQSHNNQPEIDDQKASSLSQDGVLSINVESSYASASYAYCQINIFIQDINDNPPLARISPLPRFARKQQKQTRDSSLMYVSETTAVNQILAYVAVYDPDAGENGTIKSIDLTMASFRQPSAERINERLTRIKLLQDAGYEVPNLATAKNKPSTLPFKLNKIGEKMYTIQLAEELNYNVVDSYEIEMRIQDSGTRPQLETKTTISLEVVENNKFQPLFINKQTELVFTEATYSPAETVVFSRDSNPSLQWPVVYKFTAVDLDENRNGQVTYQFFNNPYSGKGRDSAKAKQLFMSTFQLNANSGELTLLRALNRDEIDGDWLNLTVVARDNAIRNKKSSNFTISIQVADVNNNKPIFEAASANYTIYLEPTGEFIEAAEKVRKTTGLKGFKQIGSLRIKDVDSFKANSRLFNQTESDTFLFKDVSCMRSFRFDMEKSSSDENFPFVFLIESESLSSGSEAQLAENVRCQLTIWLDLNNAVGISSISKRELVEFRLIVKDNGAGNLNDEASSVLVRIDVKQAGGEDLIQIGPLGNSTMDISDTVEIHAAAGGHVAEFFLASNSSVSIEKVTLLERDIHNMPILVDAGRTDVFKIDNFRLKIDETARYGPYLIELSLRTVLDGQVSRSFERVQLVLGNDFNGEYTQLLNDYNRHNQATLSGKFQSKDSDILRLFASSSKSSVTSAILFNSQSTLNQFALLFCIVAFIVLMLFTSCICFLCKRRCQSSKKQQKDSLKTDSKKTLNVSDASSKLDDSQGGFNQIRIDQSSQKSTYDEKRIIFIDPKDKVNRYLEGLSSIGSNDIIINTEQLRNDSSSPPTSMSSLGDSTKKTSQIQQHSIKSTTSLSCISDEGCYGSSDFSTESNNNKLSQFKQLRHSQQQQYFSPSSMQQSQNHYIHNLSRFEKIYNETSMNQQAVTAISGSYV